MGTDIYMTVRANGKVVNPPKGHDEWAEKSGCSSDWMCRSYFDFTVLADVRSYCPENTGNEIAKTMVEDILVRDYGDGKPDYDWGYRLTLKELEEFDWDTKFWTSGLQGAKAYLQDIRENGRVTDHSCQGVGGQNIVVLEDGTWTDQSLERIMELNPEKAYYVSVKYWTLARDSSVYRYLLPALRSFNTEDIVVEFRFD